jgi:hypothetical protein
MNYRIVIIILIFCSGLLVLAHQALINDGVWFELDQFLHHENIAAVIIAFASGLLFSVERKKEKE